MNFRKLLFTLCFSFVFAAGLGAVSPALAEKDPLGLSYGEATGLSNQDVRFTVGRIINVALSLLGTIAVVIIIYAGFEWMTAGGSEDKVAEAKKRITYAIIGLAIILSAYAISSFVVSNLYQATSGKAYQQ